MSDINKTIENYDILARIGIFICLVSIALLLIGVYLKNVTIYEISEIILIISVIPIVFGLSGSSYLSYIQSLSGSD